MNERWGLNTMAWYALYVETKKEDLVRSMIRKYFNINAIVPKRRLKERKNGHTYEVYRTLFPGYVLVNTRMNVQLYNELKQLPKCYRLLNSHMHRSNTYKKNMNNKEEAQETFIYSEISDKEMSIVLQLIDKNEIIDFSTLYVINSKVTVCDGPLKGKEGIIKKIDFRKKRARIRFEFDGNERCIDLGIEILSVPTDVEPIQNQIKAN